MRTEAGLFIKLPGEGVDAVVIGVGVRTVLPEELVARGKEPPYNMIDQKKYKAHAIFLKEEILQMHAPDVSEWYII